MSLVVGKSSRPAGIAAAIRRRPMRWNVAAANATASTAKVTAAASVTAAAALPGTSSGGEDNRRKRTHRHDYEKSEKLLHSTLL